MQLHSWELKEPTGWMEYEALVARRVHTVSLYLSLCWSWSPATDPRHETSFSLAENGATPDLTV